MIADPRVTLTQDVRRSHAMAAKALANAGNYYAAVADPHMSAQIVEAIQLLHAVMGRTERAIRDDLQRARNRQEGMVA